jgi:hypothetical protein
MHCLCASDLSQTALLDHFNAIHTAGVGERKLPVSTVWTKLEEMMQKEEDVSGSERLVTLLAFARSSRKMDPP